MTIWAAYLNFEEKEKGSIEKGKFADFIIIDRDIMKVEINKTPKTKVLKTYLSGELVYSNTNPIKKFLPGIGTKICFRVNFI